MDEALFSRCQVYGEEPASEQPVYEVTTNSTARSVGGGPRGGHGKGFAVVAGEVRNLAHKSPESVKNIKSLIDIINQNVQQGASPVSGAKYRKDTVSGSENSDALMGHIFIPTNEQEKGIQSITTALSGLDKVTQGYVVQTC